MFLINFQQPPETLSVYRGFPMTMWDFGEAAVLITDQRGSEHIYMVRCVADGFNLTEKDRRLQLNTLVNDVKWNGECVCVTATQGARKKSYCAKYAISTVSIGALQSEVLRFDPPLPKWKQDAINKFAWNAHLLKVFVKYTHSGTNIKLSCSLNALTKPQATITFNHWTVWAMASKLLLQSCSLV